MTTVEARESTSSPPDPVSRGPRRPVLRPKGLLIAMVFGMFSCVLLVNGLITSEVGIDARGAGSEGPDDRVPLAVSQGGPVIDLTGDRSRTLVMPPKTIALTFDDGPDPEWTPQVLAVLERYHVPATFFVVGSHVAAYPDLVREIRASGSEVGLHTFTHPDLSQVSPARLDRELTATQLTVAGATGELSYLVRPPYSSEASALDNANYDVVQRLAQQDYLTTLVDLDSEDWQRPGVDEIATNIMPVDGRGAVVLLHDAGGDRSQTVQALDRVIPQLLAQGFAFTTVSAGAGLPPGDFPAPSMQRFLGKVLLGAAGFAAGVVDALEWSLLVVGGLVVLRLTVMVVVAVGHGRRRVGFTWGAPVDTPATVVVPAYNEKDTIAATVRSLVAGDHPVEVIVVDDGSVDGTADIVAALDLVGVRIIRQSNAGKPSALNAGIAAASHDIVVMMDGDTIFEPSTVRHLVQPFADPQGGAVAGNAGSATAGG